MKKFEENPILYQNNTGKGIYYLFYDNSKLGLKNEENKVIWEKTFEEKLVKVSLILGNFSNIAPTLKVELESGSLVYTTEGSLLSVDNKSKTEFPHYREQIKADLIYSEDLKVGYFQVDLNIDHQGKIYELFDSRGLCVYRGLENQISFKTIVYKEEIFQIKTRDDISIMNIQIKEIKAEAISYIIGDSTVANHSLPYWGWGQLLQTKSQEIVINEAVCGRSIKSFKLEDRLESVFLRLKDKDKLILAFAHNDQKRNFFGLSIEEFIGEVREIVEKAEKKKVKLYICTPLARRQFENDQLLESHGEYLTELKKEFSDKIIDTNAYSQKMILEVTEEESKKYFVHSDLLKIYDNTHSSILGADLLATYVAKEIKRRENENWNSST
ncbi:MAG: hypothetical protein ACK5LM_04780 [Lactovum sp.]